MGRSLAFLKNIDKKDYNHFAVEILSLEGLESSKIEGEILDRKACNLQLKNTSV